MTSYRGGFGCRGPSLLSLPFPLVFFGFGICGYYSSKKKEILKLLKRFNKKCTFDFSVSQIFLYF